MAGIVLDTSVLVAAERRGLTIDGLLSELRARHGDIFFAISAVTLMELAHGVGRADTAERQLRRRQFAKELQSKLEVLPFASDIAWRAGQLSAAMSLQGAIVGTADLMIAATALEAGAAVLTHNLRHFQLIPDLAVLTL